MTGIDPREIWSSEAAAADYEHGRPGPAPDLVARALADLGVGGASRVLDLAAGTGKLTRLLLGIAGEVVAVEPSEAMRTRLARILPPQAVLVGSAEAIPLPDANVDAVVVSDAFHWFDAALALAEIRRVLRPGGGLLVVVTTPDWDEQAPWAAELGSLLAARRLAVPAANRAEDGAWRAPLDAPAGFAPPMTATETVVHATGRDAMLAQAGSWSHVAMLPAEDRVEVLAAVAGIIDRVTQHGSATVAVPHRTDAWWMTRA